MSTAKRSVVEQIRKLKSDVKGWADTAEYKIGRTSGVDYSYWQGVKEITDIALPSLDLIQKEHAEMAKKVEEIQNLVNHEPDEKTRVNFKDLANIALTKLIAELEAESKK